MRPGSQRTVPRLISCRNVDVNLSKATHNAAAFREEKTDSSLSRSFLRSLHAHKMHGKVGFGGLCPVCMPLFWDAMGTKSKHCYIRVVLTVGGNKYRNQKTGGVQPLGASAVILQNNFIFI